MTISLEYSIGRKGKQEYQSPQAFNFQETLSAEFTAILSVKGKGIYYFTYV